MSVMLWVRLICPDGWLITLGETMEKKMENFKTWDVTYTAKLVSNSNINVALIQELIEKAMRSEAGSIGYLIGDSETKLDQTSGNQN
jgi:hypothetical protein